MPVASGVVKRFDSVMISLWPSPLAFFAARKPSPPAPPGLVDHNDGLLGQVMLGDNALRHAGHLIGATAGTGGNNNFDRMGRFPRLRRNRHCHCAAKTERSNA
jgi:hypothetical protein